MTALYTTSSAPVVTEQQTAREVKAILLARAGLLLVATGCVIAAVTMTVMLLALVRLLPLMNGDMGLGCATLAVVFVVAVVWGGVSCLLYNAR